jgi:hypothetical protein
LCWCRAGLVDENELVGLDEGLRCAAMPAPRADVYFTGSSPPDTYTKARALFHTVFHLSFESW